MTKKEHKNLTPLFFMLYFFEGAPIGLVWWAIPTIMASNGIGVEVITSLVSLAALPWTFKFLLAPLVDRWFETVRGYALGVACFQFLMIICLVLMLITPIDQPLFFWIALGISFFSAVQDVFIDGWAIGVVSDQSRGKVNGAMQSGMLTGRWFFGSGLLMALASIQWQIAVGFLCLATALSVIFLIVRFSKQRKIVSLKEESFSLSSFQFIFSKRFITLGIIAAFSGFAFESLGATIGPFLVNNSFVQFDIGLIMSGTLFTMLVGALVGGKLTDRVGDHSMFFKTGMILALVVTIIGILDQSSNSVAIITAIFFAYLFVGGFVASSYSFYMRQSQDNMQATRFTFLMAMTNLSESAAAFTVGRLIAAGDGSYATGYISTSMISLVGLATLWLFSRRKMAQN